MHPTRKLPVGFSDQPILILMLKISQTQVTSCFQDRYTKKKKIKNGLLICIKLQFK